MLHDYGFYKFEKFDNYLNAKERASIESYLMPIFEQRSQFVNYDEAH